MYLVYNIIIVFFWILCRNEVVFIYYLECVGMDVEDFL